LKAALSFAICVEIRVEICSPMRLSYHVSVSKLFRLS